MRRFLGLLFLIGLFITVYIYRSDITSYIINNFIYNKEIVVKDPNQYRQSYEFEYIKETDNFYPKNNQDIINIFYTFLNNGWDEFTFYCPSDYTDCINDVSTLSSRSESLSHLNNFVHPYNSYETIIINYNNFGSVTIKVEKLYSEDDIKAVEKEVDKIYNDLIKEDMNIRTKIKAIHDYIINITKYDHERADAISNNFSNYNYTYKSNMAYGPLIQNMAICSGYSDAMAIFLNRMNIPNLKVANDNHIWNLVYIDDEWLHLDLTWDDPIVESKEDVLIHKYFLINTEELEKINDQQHYYNKNIYIEAK